MNEKTHPINNIIFSYSYIATTVFCFVVLVITCFVVLLSPSRESELLLFYAIVMGFLFFPAILLKILLTPLSLFMKNLEIKNIAYEFQADQLIHKYGIFSKSQRTLRYAVIQNVIIYRNLFDFLFGTATLQIENATPSVMPIATESGQSFMRMIGGVIIPGLTVHDAEEIKLFLQTKIKDSANVMVSQGL